MKRTKEKAEAENSAQVNKGRGPVSTRIKDAYQRPNRSRSRRAYGRYQPRESHAGPPRESLRASSPPQGQVHGGVPGRAPAGPIRRWTCGGRPRHARFRGILGPFEIPSSALAWGLVYSV